jgi:hypothetical protein
VVYRGDDLAARSFRLAMATEYHIRLKGHLADHWSDWFEGMTISNEANGEAVLRGSLPDQAALHGVLIKIRDLGMPLLAVATVATSQSQNNGTRSNQ